jgi:ferredoxin--NADP+ reductase
MAESKYTRQTVTALHTWVEGKLFSLRVTRDPAFRFQPGQFARLGLPEADAANAEPTVWRAYSMVSSPQDTELEFYSIVVPGGQFSLRLANLRVGDPIFIDKTAFGFLTLERFAPAVDLAAGHPAAGLPAAGVPAAGAPAASHPAASSAAANRIESGSEKATYGGPDQGTPPVASGELWLLATGTGLSAYMSILRDAEVWRRYAHVIVAHGVRELHEFAYRTEIEDMKSAHPGQLTYLPIATRDEVPGMPQARLTQLLEDGRLEILAGQRLHPSTSKIMLCGNPAMLADARKLLGKNGFLPGRRGIPGNLAVENYW